MYRGYDIADLAEHSTYEETAYLLLEGELPTDEELDAFRAELSRQELPRETADVVDSDASSAAPMELLRTAVSTLSFSDPGSGKTDRDSARRTAAGLIARTPTIVARYHRRRQGLEPVEPDASLTYSESFLTMLHGEQPSESAVRAFDVAMILHAEHEMNASTFTARVVAGTLADLTAAVTAAVAALGGPLHGGANERAMELFERIGSAERAASEVDAALGRGEKLFGFGHPLYRAYDPRARILKQIAHRLAEDGGDPDWYAVADATESAVHDAKGLYPNVDLYSGPVYRYLGVPNELFTPLFAASRLAGWSAHVLEQYADNKIIRPSAEYVGEARRRFPVRQRS
jgi:citrate synthase